MLVEWYQQCKDCKGTGLYVGMAESRGGAVICHTCGGTGEQHQKFEYEEFIERKPHQATWVYAVNPGIVVDNGKIVTGGVSKVDWEKDPLSPWLKGKEMREHTCPTWWYQLANYDLKPDWKDCDSLGGAISSCSCFHTKALCWAKWDEEHSKILVTKRFK